MDETLRQLLQSLFNAHTELAQLRAEAERLRAAVATYRERCACGLAAAMQEAEPEAAAGAVPGAVPPVPSPEHGRVPVQ